MRPERDPRACSDCGFLAGACECDSLRGDAERYGSERTATLDGDLSQRYVTEGIESGVEDLDRGIVGHVGLFDIDESGRERALTVARRLPGPVAVLRSSRRSWHLWRFLSDRSTSGSTGPTTSTVSTRTISGSRRAGTARSSESTQRSGSRTGRRSLPSRSSVVSSTVEWTARSRSPMQICSLRSLISTRDRSANAVCGSETRSPDGSTWPTSEVDHERGSRRQRL